MSAKVLVIGVDAAEATLMDRWARAGSLPAFARLSESGAQYRLSNSMQTLPGAIWPEIVTGRSVCKVGLYYPPRQLHTGEAVARRVGPEEVDPDDYYWSTASRAGRRCAVIDQVQTVRVPNFNGIQLFEWGLHDRHFRIASDPPGLLEDLRARFGDHPVRGCDRHGGQVKGYRDLLSDLLHGVAQKSRFSLDLLSEEDWDLFAVTFSETHCVGHQFWHFHDKADRRHDPAAPHDLAHAIETVYGAVDGAIGKLVSACDDDTTVLVIASHGMGPYIGGYQLLPEVLLRLGLGASAAGGRLSRIAEYSRHKTRIRDAYQALRSRVALPGRGRPLCGSRMGASVRSYFECPVDLGSPRV